MVLIYKHVNKTSVSIRQFIQPHLFWSLPPTFVALNHDVQFYSYTNSLVLTTTFGNLVNATRNYSVLRSPRLTVSPRRVVLFVGFVFFSITRLNWAAGSKAMIESTWQCRNTREISTIKLQLYEKRWSYVYVVSGQTPTSYIPLFIWDILYFVLHVLTFTS